MHYAILTVSHLASLTLPWEQNVCSCICSHFITGLEEWPIPFKFHKGVTIPTLTTFVFRLCLPTEICCTRKAISKLTGQMMLNWYYFNYPSPKSSLHTVNSTLINSRVNITCNCSDKSKQVHGLTQVQTLITSSTILCLKTSTFLSFQCS